MNIACSSCPAKYAIPDEKVRGRKVRITCKRCGAAIVVDGTALPAGGEAAPPSAAGAPSERVRQRTMLGGLRAPMDSAPGAPVSQPPPPPGPQIGLPRPGGAAKAPAAGFPAAAKQSATSPSAELPKPPAAATPAAKPPAEETKWTVAVTEEDHREMATSEVVEAYAARTIDHDTFVWREGMDDWLGPFEIPEIAAALAAKGHVSGATAAAEPAPKAEARPAQKSGAWTEPGRWDQGQQGAPNPAFDDVTVAMAAPQAQELLVAAKSSDPAGAEVTADALGFGDGDVERPRGAAPRPAAGAPPPAAPAFKLPFEEDAPAATAAPFEHSAPARDLFAHASGADEEPRPRAHAKSIPPEPAGPHGSLTGARNESSVLFSLDQLMGKPAAKAPSPRAEKIDAEALLLGGAPRGGDDEPPSVANMGGGALFNHAAMAAPDFNAPPPPSAPHHPTPSSPPPTPSAAESSSKTGLWVALGLVALLGAGGAAFVFLKPAPAAAPPSPAIAAAPVAPAVPPAPMATVAPTPTPPPSEAPAAAPAASGATSAAPGAPAAPPTAATPAAPQPGAAPAAAPAATAPAGTKPAAAAAATPAAPKPAAAEPAAADGPEFNKEAAAAALGAAVAQAQSECASQEGTHGTGKVQITFVNSGRATNALVSGDFAGSALGGCVARVFRSVKVPAFSGDSVRVNKTVHVQ